MGRVCDGEPKTLELRYAVRQDRLLDPPGLVDEAFEPLLPHLRVEDRADDAEREEEVVRLHPRMHVEREEEALLAERHRVSGRTSS